MEKPPASKGTKTPGEKPLPSSEKAQKRLLQEVIFEVVHNGKGELIGYKSSSPDRKRVTLSETSATPIPGVPYEVRIIDEKNPDDPMKGSYIVEIVPGQKIQMTTEEWEGLDDAVNVAETFKRESNQASAELYEQTGIPKAERANADSLPSNRIIEKAKIIEEEMDKEVIAVLEKEEHGDQIKQLIGLRKENLVSALRQERDIQARGAALLDEESELLKAIEDGGSSAAYKALREVTESLDALREEGSDLPNTSPEAYYGLHLKQLKEYKHSLDSGHIVETPYVKERAEDIYAHMRSGKPVLIYGHLGTGKTELAMHVARKYAGTDALVISGSKNMSLAEVYGHQVLQLDSMSSEALKDFTTEVEGFFKEWEAANPNSTEAEKGRMHDTILQTHLTKLQKGTITDFFMGPLYRAMEEGRPLIIDEVNAIPHEILISLNHILTRKPGDEVLVQQDSGKIVTVKEGFGVLMTGNLNQGQDIYIDRQDMDPALLSRLYKVEYDYLPQETGDTSANGIEKTNELLDVILAKLIDRQGNLQTPEKSFEALRELAMGARITQDVFAGREVDSSFFMQVPGAANGVRYLLKESVLSLRALDAIVSQWQKDGFKLELDYYLWNEFIGQSTQASDRAYLYQLFQNRFGFFQGEWEQNPDIPAGGNIRSFVITPPRTPAEKVAFMAPREMIDLAYGPGPSRTTWPVQDPE